MTTNKREDLKQRMAVVLKDLKENGRSDPEALALVGSLAAELTNKTRTQTWASLKQKMTQGLYEEMMRDFQANGNELFKAGRKRHAFAIQVLGISLAASTQRIDAEMRQGELLLDAMIDNCLKAYKIASKP
jgi:hypothetical protein